MPEASPKPMAGNVPAMPVRADRRGQSPWLSCCLQLAGGRDLSAPGPELEDRLDAEAATEAFLEHEFDRMSSWQRLRESELEERRDASGLGGSTMWITAEEMRQIHDEIWPILERYTERVEDPSLRPPDARAARVLFFTGVSPRR
jgi:hypothetical protein